MMKKMMILGTMVFVIFGFTMEVCGANWKFFAWSEKELPKLVTEKKAELAHYYDKGSITRPYKDKDLVRVWVKCVVLGRTRSYKDLKEEWDRRIKPYKKHPTLRAETRYDWYDPRDPPIEVMIKDLRESPDIAIKEEWTLLEMDCSKREISELKQGRDYDSDKKDLDRHWGVFSYSETMPETVGDALCKEICKKWWEIW